MVACLRAVAVGFFVFIAGQAVAQTPKPILTLSEAEFSALFLKNSPLVAALQSDIESSQAEQVASALWANPSLSLEREAVFGDETTPYDQFARLTLPLDIAGKRGKRSDAAQKAVLATRAEVDQNRFFLHLDALDVYYDAAQARMRLDVLVETRTQLTALMESVRTRKANGDASGYDVKRVELELGTHDDYLQEAEAELHLCQRRLGLLVGQPDRLIASNDTLVVSKASFTNATNATGPSLTMRSDIRAARLHVEEAMAEASAARRSWIPPVTVSAGVKQSDLGTETATGYAVGLSLELPIFDHGQAQARRASTKKKFWLSKLRGFEQSAKSETEASRYQLSQRLRQIERFEKTQAAGAVKLLRLADAAYREGEKPMFELLDAYRTARDVRLRFVELRRQAKSAEMAVWRAMGHR